LPDPASAFLAGAHTLRNKLFSIRRFHPSYLKGHPHGCRLLYEPEAASLRWVLRIRANRRNRSAVSGLTVRRLGIPSARRKHSPALEIASKTNCASSAPSPPLTSEPAPRAKAHRMRLGGAREKGCGPAPWKRALSRPSPCSPISPCRPWMIGSPHSSILTLSRSRLASVYKTPST